MIKKVSFRKRLLFGFGFVLLFFFFSIGFFFNQNSKLSKDADVLYNNALVVSRAVRDIQIGINEIFYHDLEKILQSSNTEELAEALTQLNSNDSLVVQNFKIIRNNFLGDMKMVDEAELTYLEWEKNLDLIKESFQKGLIDNALMIRKQVASPQILVLDQKLKFVTDHANQEGNSIYFKIKKAHQKNEIFLKIISSVLVLLSILTALIVSQSISVPLTRFVSDIKNLLKIKNTELGKKMNEEEVFELTKKELSDAYQAIIRFNNELELKVKERTHELKKSHNDITAQNEEIIAQNEEYQALNDLYKAQNDALVIAKKAVEESEKKLNLALENGKIGTWEMNPESWEITLDARMQKILNLRNSSSYISYESFEKLLHEEDLNHIRQALKKALKEEIAFESVFRVKKAFGEVNYISAKAMMVKDVMRQPVKLSGVCFDITEMKKGAEQVLFKLNEELLRSNQELQSFAYIASHDLKEPLRMVSNFTQLLLMRYGNVLDKDGKDFIKFAIEGAKRMNAVINSLLEYSRMQSAGLNLTEVNMNAVVMQVCRYLDLQIKENNVTVKVGDLPVINADENQIVHLVQNLVSNAIKFRRQNSEIHISAKKLENHFLFSVKDNGIGIAPQYFEKIFEIFKRLHTRDLYEGTGIGLAFCRRIVERHDGKIWLESELGKGTTFYFTIPITKKPQA